MYVEDRSSPAVSHRRSLPPRQAALSSSLSSIHFNEGDCQLPGGALQRCRMEQDVFLSSDELDDDVFYPDDFGFPVQPLTPSAMFTHSPSYTCMLGRFQLFPLSHCCGPGCRIMDCEDKATQTLEPSSVNRDIMLPCGVAESPQRLFYGNAGYLLHQPTDLDMQIGEETQHRRLEQSAERRIARKLQCIGDQFHRLHLQRIQQNRNQVWFQIFIFFRNLVLPRDRNRGVIVR